MAYHTWQSVLINNKNSFLRKATWTCTPGSEVGREYTTCDCLSLTFLDFGSKSSMIDMVRNMQGTPVRYLVPGKVIEYHLHIKVSMTA